MQMDNRMKVIAGFLLAGALIRLLPHPLNFTPIGAMALFGGACLRDKKLAFFLPMTALLLSDMLLEQLYGTGRGFHATMLFVYGSMGLITLIGFMLRGREKFTHIALASLSGSVLFFAITNFGVWLVQNIYPKTSAGLAECYVAAIPFFGGTFLGDLFYNLVFFGGFALAGKMIPGLVKK